MQNSTKKIYLALTIGDRQKIWNLCTQFSLDIPLSVWEDKISCFRWHYKILDLVKPTDSQFFHFRTRPSSNSCKGHALCQNRVRIIFEIYRVFLIVLQFMPFENTKLYNTLVGTWCKWICSCQDNREGSEQNEKHKIVEEPLQTQRSVYELGLKWGTGFGLYAWKMAFYSLRL